MAALILMWIKFLTWKGIAPPNCLLPYDLDSGHAGVLSRACFQLGNHLRRDFSGMWAWSGQWWQPLVALARAILLDSFCHKSLYAIIKWATGDANGNSVLAGSAFEHWSYIGGRSAIEWVAFGMARAAGVRLQRPDFPEQSRSATGC